MAPNIKIGHKRPYSLDKIPTKRRRQSRPSSSLSFDPRYFRNEDAFKAFKDDFEDRKLVQVKTVDVAFFEQLPVIDWLRRQGWLGVVQLKKRIYPVLVRQFYANLRMTKTDEDGEFMDCFVKGIRFNLTPSRLNQIAKINPPTPLDPRPRGLTGVDIKKRIVKPNGNFVHPRSSDLDIPTRLLMHIINMCIRPIGGHFTDLSKIVAGIIFDVKFGYEADSGSIMLRHFASARS